MAIKFEKIQDGMTLYDRHTHRMGNTTLKTIGEWKVSVIKVDREKREALVSWSGNKPETWSEHRLTRLFDWGMRDPGVTVVKSGWAVVKVTKKKPAKVAP